MVGTFLAIAQSPLGLCKLHSVELALMLLVTGLQELCKRNANSLSHTPAARIMPTHHLCKLHSTTSVVYTVNSDCYRQRLCQQGCCLTLKLTVVFVESNCHGQRLCQKVVDFPTRIFSGGRRRLRALIKFKIFPDNSHRPNRISGHFPPPTVRYPSK